MLNFNQKIKIDLEVERQSWITYYCKNKSVIDVGCCDIGMNGAPLHKAIKQVASKVIGVDCEFDPEFEGEKLEINFDRPTPYIPSNVRNSDILIAGEIIEHLSNPTNLFSFIAVSNPKAVIITAPNAFAPNRFSENRYVNDSYEEIVHPDHKAWYSPYTLVNLIKKELGYLYTIYEVVLIDNQNSIGVYMSRPFIKGKV